MVITTQAVLHCCQKSAPCYYQIESASFACVFRARLHAAFCRSSVAHLEIIWMGQGMGRASAARTLHISTHISTLTYSTNTRPLLLPACAHTCVREYCRRIGPFFGRVSKQPERENDALKRASADDCFHFQELFFIVASGLCVLALLTFSLSPVSCLSLSLARSVAACFSHFWLLRITR